MYHDFFGIAENPFSITPDPRYLYMSSGHEEALAHLLYGVGEGGGFVLLTGEVGTGKTSICRCLLEQLPETAAVALILNPRLDEIELLASICDELGVDYPEGTRSLKVLVDRLNHHLLALHAAGRQGVVIIDEAQDLSPQVLEQVRLLTNLETATRKLLQVILIGQPELNTLLARPELRQVVQRITARYHLQPLGRADTQAYVQHRLAVGGLAPELFNGRATSAVYRHARGVPRLINSLCDRCLLGAYAQNRKAVDARLVRQAAREVFGPRLDPRRAAPTALAWLAVAAVLIVGSLLAFDPMDLGLLPQAEGWRTATNPQAVSDSGAAPKPPREQAGLQQPSGQAAGDGMEFGDSVAAREPTAALPPVAPSGPAAPESAAGRIPGPVEADARATTEPAGVISAAPDSELAAATAPAMTTGDDGGPPVAVAAVTSTPSDPESPGKVSEVAPSETAVVDTGDTEEAAPMFRMSDPPTPATAERLAASEAEKRPSGAADGTAMTETIARTAPVDALEGSVFEAAKDFAPDEALTIEDLFTRSALPTDRDSALTALFELWDLNGQRLGGPPDCTRSAVLGVKCLAEKTSWKTVIGLNRPVVITLEDARGRRARAVLAAVQDGRATLLAGDRRIVADVATVRAHWAGEYLMLWRPPPVYSGLLALGARGQEVAWLKARLAEVNGEPSAELRDAVFDAALHEKVMAFQKSRGLKPDGLVGVRTLIHLNSAKPDAGVPLLRPAAP